MKVGSGITDQESIWNLLTPGEVLETKPASGPEQEGLLTTYASVTVVEYNGFADVERVSLKVMNTMKVELQLDDGKPTEQVSCVHLIE